MEREREREREFGKSVPAVWLDLVYYCWVLPTIRNLYINIIWYFYSSILMWSRRVIGGGESLCIQRKHRESKLPAGTDLSQNSWPYIVLKLPRDSHAMLFFYWSWLTPTQCFFFHWPWFTPMQCLLFTGHALHSHNACSPLITAYSHTFLVSGSHFVDFIYGLMYLSIIFTGFNAGQGDILHW